MVGTRAAMMVKFFAGIIIILMLLHTRGSESTRPLVRFNTVSISSERVVKATQKESVELPNAGNQLLFCSHVCSVRPWCQLSCVSSSRTECIVSSAIALANYNESSVDDVLECITTYGKDFATGANITGIVGAAPASVPEHLVDGIYGISDSECFQSGPTGKWFFIDLGVNRTVHRIRILPLPNEWAWITSEVDVRVGTSVVNNPPTGFADYEEFGFFPGPATANQNIIMEVSQSVTGRFVSFEKQAADGYSFVICHVEIY